MKTLITFSFLFLFVLNCVAQIDEQKLLYLQKTEKYRKMKNTGRILTITGGALFIAGIVTLANSSTTTYTNSYGQTTTNTSANYGKGLAAYLLGTAGVGAGVPLWIVGGHAQRKYQRKLDAMTLSINSTGRERRLGLVYRF